KSLTPALRNPSASPTPRTLYWQFGKARAIRDGNWKAVKLGSNDWELYDLAADPTETQDRSQADPNKTKQLSTAWKAWWSTKQ
ncbi:MAG: arylsulfatase, partial [Planctomycetota bacterium]